MQIGNQYRFQVALLHDQPVETAHPLILKQKKDVLL